MTEKDVVGGQLNNVLWKTVYQSENGTKPEEIGWEEYIAMHPEIVQYEYGIASIVAKGARPSLENLPVHKQKLAGAIIRATFTNIEIERYGREEV